jgi:hypothetical protein
MKLLTIMLACAALGATACTHGAQLSTPPGFAEIGSSGDYDYRATDSRGVAIAVRREANDPSGDLTFWAGAIDAHLRRGGYQAVDVTKVQSADGVEGRQIRYSTVREGREHVFVVAVYVTQSDVVTVEAGGDVEFVKEQEKALSRAMASITIAS